MGGHKGVRTLLSDSSSNILYNLLLVADIFAASESTIKKKEKNRLDTNSLVIIALSILRDPETSDVSEDSKAGSFGFLVAVALLKVTLSNRRGPPKGKRQQTTCRVLNAR